MKARHTSCLALALAFACSAPARAQEELISPQVQSAVDRGLEWLAKSQSGDGSWGGGTAGGSSAVTGLAVMAFMARGHVPGQGPYGEQLNKGIDAILASQSPDGVLARASLTQSMYDHGIATVALCEAYGMLDDRRQERARTAIARAVRLTLDAQRITKNASDQGGWRYTPTSTDADTSVTGWQLMALRGAKNIGAFLPKDAIDDGIDYLNRQAVLGGGFAYSRGGRANMALTGTGILALSLMGKGDSPQVRAGGDYLLRNNIANEGHFFYAVYYCSQAAYHLGGKYWDAINRSITTILLAKQEPNGGWRPIGLGDGTGGDSYCTAMAVLALTVPYRYLPIYQR